MTLGKREALFFFLYFSYGFKTLLVLVPLTDSLILLTRNTINGLLFFVMVISVFYIPFKARLLLAFFSVVFVYNFITTGNNGLYNYLVLFVVLGISINLNLKYILSIVLSVNIILFLFIIPFIFISGEFYMTDLRYNAERFTLGFSSPNTMAQYLVMIYLTICLYTYKYCNKGIYFVSAVISFIIIFTLIYLSVSRTGLALLISAFFGMMTLGLLKNDSKDVRFLKTIYIVALISICVLQLYLVLGYTTGGAFRIFNILLSGRLSMPHYMYLALGYIPIINGVNIDPYLPIDFYFIRMIFSLGFLISIVLFYVFRSQFLSKTYSPVGYVVLFVGLLSTFTESYFSVFFMNISLLLVYCNTKHC